MIHRVTTNDNEWYHEWQQVVQQVTTNDNEWQRMTKSDNEWQRVVISANFPFSWIKEEPKQERNTKQSKGNSVNLAEDFEEGLLN